MCPRDLSKDYVDLTTLSVLIFSMKQLTAEASAIRSGSENFFRYLIYIYIYISTAMHISLKYTGCFKSPVENGPHVIL